jgi:hypothetical protein
MATGAFGIKQFFAQFIGGKVALGNGFWFFGGWGAAAGSQKSYPHRANPKLLHHTAKVNRPNKGAFICTGAVAKIIC